MKHKHEDKEKSAEEKHNDTTELCAKAFKLAMYAVMGAVLANMLAVAGLYPHAAEEVKSLMQTTKNAVEAPAIAHGGK